jgi:acetate kinase
MARARYIDMRKLLLSNEPAAQPAVNVYCYRARKCVGACLAVLGAADAILFGVGEHAGLVHQGVQKFTEPYERLLTALERRAKELAG